MIPFECTKDRVSYDVKSPDVSSCHHSATSSASGHLTYQDTAHDPPDGFLGEPTPCIKPLEEFSTREQGKHEVVLVR